MTPKEMKYNLHNEPTEGIIHNARWGSILGWLRDLFVLLESNSMLSVLVRVYATYIFHNKTSLKYR